MKVAVIASSLALVLTMAGGIGSAQAGERYDSRGHYGAHGHKYNRDQTRDRHHRARRDHGFRHGRHWGKHHHPHRLAHRHPRHHDWRRHHRHASVGYGYGHRHHAHPANHRVVVYSEPSPALAGAVLGGALANHASHGDAGATVVGAVMGAMIANNHH